MQTPTRLDVTPPPAGELNRESGLSCVAVNVRKARKARPVLTQAAQLAIASPSAPSLPKGRVSGKTPVPNVKPETGPEACLLRAMRETEASGKGAYFRIGAGYFAASLNVETLNAAQLTELRQAEQAILSARIDSYHKDGTNLKTSQKARLVAETLQGVGKDGKECVIEHVTKTWHHLPISQQVKRAGQEYEAERSRLVAYCRDTECPATSDGRDACRYRANAMLKRAKAWAVFAGLKSTARLSGWIADDQSKLDKLAKANEKAEAVKAKSGKAVKLQGHAVKDPGHK